MDKLLDTIKNINLGIFNNINRCYVIGDIHGDIHKFLSFLKSINIIKNFNLPKNYNSYNISIEQMKKDIDNYISFEKLNFKNICIVQLGDITDGHNGCKHSNKDFKNNDIMVYAVIEKVIELFNELINCHFILIAGNHDIENIFDIYGIENKVDMANCDLLNSSHWAQYVLNYDEINLDIETKKKVVYDKLTKRKNYLQNDFDFFNNMYFIVSINDKTFFSHTLFYKSILKKLKHIKNLDLVINNSLITFINNLFKLSILILKKKNKDNKLNKNIFNEIINTLFLLCSKRSKRNNQLQNENDIVKANGYYFVGHEIQKEINKIKHNMFNLYVYYTDIGLSKSLYDKNTLTNYYYIVIDYKKGIAIKKCSDEKCMNY